MRHSQISRYGANAFLAFVMMGMAAACADSIVAPTREVSVKAPAGFDRTIGVKVFTVYPYGTIQALDRHILTIPSNAICDPVVSTYGPGEWDKPCTPLTRPITITATMMENDQGHPYVDFQPALRFVPTREVNLYLRSGKDSIPRMLNIEYCNNLGICVDESLKDPTLATRRVGETALLVRRIKHFSGYLIHVGDECNGTVTEELDGTLMCWEGGFEKRGGYMVASGVIKKKAKTNDQ